MAKPAARKKPAAKKSNVDLRGAASTDVGRHNANLELTQLRLIKGSSWKRQDLIVLLPAAQMIPAKCALSWWNLIFPPNNVAAKVLIQGMEVGEAYSTAIEQMLAHPQLGKFKWFLTIEHDNVPPQDGVLKLIEHAEAHPDFGAISGLYFTKGPEGQPQIWGDIKDPMENYRPMLPDPNGGLVECYGIGMGFALWRLEMFRDPKLRKPWFKTNASLTEGVGTQDLYFWHDARKYGYRCGVACNVPVGHHDAATDTTW